MESDVARLFVLGSFAGDHPAILDCLTRTSASLKGKGRLMDGWASRGFCRCLTDAVMTIFVAVSIGALSLPARADDRMPQTQASKDQVEKLITQWRSYEDGANSLSQKRAAFEKFMSAAPGPTRIQVRPLDVDGIEAELLWPARLHHPIGRRVILYLHGGGFYSGSSNTHRALAGSLAKSASADVLLINYRRTPEYGYPAQVDDALTAYRWLLSSGYRNDNIVIAGDSVGGTLAIETVLRQLEVKGPLPAAVIAMSPVTDFAATGTSMTANADTDPFMGKAELETIRQAYLGHHNPEDPEVSPLYASMAGFPPLLLQVGSRETLMDDTLRLAAKARDADVDVTAEVWPGMIHQWQIFPFWLDDADRSNAKAAEFAVRHFADKPQE